MGFASPNRDEFGPRGNSGRIRSLIASDGVQSNHVVEHIPAAVADPAFSNTILPRTAEPSSLRLDVKALHCADHFTIKLCATIKD
jgi:hypothetical protein